MTITHSTNRDKNQQKEAVSVAEITDPSIPIAKSAELPQGVVSRQQGLSGKGERVNYIKEDRGKGARKNPMDTRYPEE